MINKQFQQQLRTSQRDRFFRSSHEAFGTPLTIGDEWRRAELGLDGFIAVAAFSIIVAAMLVWGF
jgi:hypothetical protein